MVDLKPDHYHKAEQALADVPFNRLFAETVTGGYVTGRVYVDTIDEPSAFYICHPYGMSLLVGSPGNPGFNERLRNFMLNENRHRSKREYLLVHPEDWCAVLAESLGARLAEIDFRGEDVPSFIERHEGDVVLNRRINFTFNLQRYRDFQRLNHGAVTRLLQHISPVGEDEFTSFNGVVVPKHFWDSYDHFRNYSTGFCLKADGRVVSAAFCSFYSSTYLELGMETAQGYRGRGLSAATCSALIDYALERDLIPAWACILSNRPSYKLAGKLGFVELLSLPCYMLPFGGGR